MCLKLPTDGVHYLQLLGVTLVVLWGDLTLVIVQPARILCGVEWMEFIDTLELMLYRIAGNIRSHYLAEEP